ncbi:MAG: histidine phosphatase family protein [Candidatus Saganbacteria bacterium]|nr:histidine phosphatase family protein [Candidatus Saganbacteria bacterium]
MQRTKIFLIRHGETESNKEFRYMGQGESPLSDQGKKEAGSLSQSLKGVPLDVIYCSTLGRSKETAEIIAKHHKGIPIKQEKDLMERYYGVFENKTFGKIIKEMPDLYNQWLYHPNQAIIPQAETLKELQDRAAAATEKIIKKHQGQTIFIVGHGGTNRTILFHFMGLSLDNFFRIKQDNCCVNIIEIDERGPMVALLNSTFFIGEKRIRKEGRY